MKTCSHLFEEECDMCAAANAAIAVADAKSIEPGDRVRMRGVTGVEGTVNEVAGSYAYVSWDCACTRKDPMSWIERAP